MDKHAAIEFNDVHFEYRLEDSNTLNIIKGLSFLINKNEFITLIGPSGCGKSTLLYLIANILKPTQGDVKVDFGLVKDASGFVFQDYVLFPWRNILENVRLPLELKGIKNSEANKLASEYIHLVGLDDFVNSFPIELSGGMKQRVGIARALITESPILLMDEPFNALDDITRQEMYDELINILSVTKRTVVFVTHNINEAIFLSDKIFVLSKRPSIIKKIIEVKLPKPRDTTILSSPEFYQAYSETQQALKEK